MSTRYPWPSINYAKFSTDGFTKKHFLGVFDTNEVLEPDATVNGTAAYFVCDALEKQGWRKLTHNHDLEKDGVVVQLRARALCKEDNITVDTTFTSLQRPQEALDKMLKLITDRVWEAKPDLPSA